MKKWKNLSIQLKLIAAFLLTFFLIFFVNLILYANINFMSGRIDQVYQSNSSLNELSEALGAVHSSMTEYLNVKSSDTLDSYYRNSQELNRRLQELNTEICSDELLMMERNIRNMTLEYLHITDEATQAKRGRNIEKYRLRYEEAVERFEYINTYIYSLNNRRFKTNTNSYETFARALRRFELVGTVILAAVGVLIAALIYAITKSITGPLSHLALRANEVAEGNLEVDLVPVRSMDEVGIVTTAFNQMVSSIRIHMERIKENMEKEAAMKEKELMMEGHLKDAQLKYLQAQINPHFLYNTLDSIIWMAEWGKNQEVVRMTSSLAKLLRRSISNEQETVTVAEEVEYTETYLTIQKMRYKDKLEYEIAVEPDILQERVIKLILQPLVENAIYHGIKYKEGKGLLRIQGFREGDHMILRVQDDGKGMDSETLAHIFEKHTRDTRSNGVGLNNVNERIQIYYGDDYGISFESSPGKGTEATITLPFGKEEGRDEEL